MAEAQTIHLTMQDFTEPGAETDPPSGPQRSDYFSFAGFLSTSENLSGCCPGIGPILSPCADSSSSSLFFSMRCSSVGRNFRSVAGTNRCPVYDGFAIRSSLIGFYLTASSQYVPSIRFFGAAAWKGLASRTLDQVIPLLERLVQIPPYSIEILAKRDRSRCTGWVTIKRWIFESP